MITNEVPNRCRVQLRKFTEHDLNDSFVAYGDQWGIFHVAPLGGGLFAVEIASVDQNRRRYLTQPEADSLHYGIRASDGIKELRVELE